MLRVIKLKVTMLKVTMLNVIMLNVIMLNVIMLNATNIPFMLSAIKLNVFGDCYSVECHYAECHGAIFLPPTLFLPRLCSSSFSPDFWLQTFWNKFSLKFRFFFPKTFFSVKFFTMSSRWLRHALMSFTSFHVRTGKERIKQNIFTFVSKRRRRMSFQGI